MEVRAFVARRTADVADHLAAQNAIALVNGRVVQVGVERVVATTMVDQDRRQVEPQRSRETHGAARDRADRGADRRPDPDAVAGDARIVGAGRRAERIDDGALDRPIEAAEVARRDRAGSSGDAARLRLAPGAFQRLDPIVERAFIAIQAREPLLRRPRAAAGRAEVGFALALEREITAELIGPLLAATCERLTRIHEELALARDAVTQLEHVIGEQAVLPAHEEQVLIARQQVTEALGRQEYLPTVQRAPLVDVHEPPLEYGPFLEQRVLGNQQIHRDLVDLPAETRDLTVELVDDAVGALLLLLNVRDFVGERVRLGPKAVELLLDLGTLAADSLEPALILLHLLLIGGALGVQNGTRETGHGKR